MRGYGAGLLAAEALAITNHKMHANALAQPKITGLGEPSVFLVDEGIRRLLPPLLTIDQNLFSVICTSSRRCEAVSNLC